MDENPYKAPDMLPTHVPGILRETFDRVVMFLVSAFIGVIMLVSLAAAAIHLLAYVLDWFWRP